MTDFYSSAHRSFQDTFDTRHLADVLEKKVMRQEFASMDKRFIEACDFFFLSTLDQRGWPTVSYKGGFPGFVKILDDTTLAFPIYDGNGMFYSVGNISDTSKVGLLFIDFEQPRRLRVHGTANVKTDDPLMDRYHEARLIVRIAVENIFTNCPRYIHPHKRSGISQFVPKEGTVTPVPDWKRVDIFQDKLPASDKRAAEKAGDIITEEEYRKDFWRGLE